MIDLTAVPITDDSFASAVFKATRSNEPIILPPGGITLTKPLPTIDGGTLQLQGQNTVIAYVGKAPGPIFPLSGLRRFYTHGVGFDGGGQPVIDVQVGVGGGWTPSQYRMKSGFIRNTPLAFRVGSSSNCDGGLFEQIEFMALPGGTGFQNDNPNSVCNTFTHCNFSGGSYGIVNHTGSFTAINCQFSGSSVSDILISQSLPIEIIGGWTEASYRFLTIPFAEAAAMVRLSSVFIASSPDAYVTRTGNSLNPAEVDPNLRRAAILCNRQAGLEMVNCMLGNPYDSKPVYVYSQRPLAEPIQWRKSNCYANGGDRIFNQAGAVS